MQNQELIKSFSDAMKEKNNNNLKNLLTAGGFDINVEIFPEDEQITPKTALIYAAEEGYTEGLSLLITHKANKEAPDKDGRTALMHAAQKGQLAAVTLLIDNGADIAAADKNGQTALMHAAQQGQTAPMTALIAKAANIAAVDKNWQTALMHATQTGQIEAMRLLIEKTAALEALDASGSTALILAAQKGQLAAMTLLIDKGANINAVDNEGNNALIIAGKNGYRDIVVLLKEKGLKFDDYFAEIKLSEEQNNQIFEITEKIVEGNNRITGTEENAMLLLGNTGSGKSTLAHLLMDKDLQAIYNDELGEIVIESAKNDLEYIKIGHTTISETKIPNKCQISPNTLIWDCPGFNDTNPIQELANSFYIKKLYHQHENLKFIFVISYASMKGNRATNFVNYLEEFCKQFKNIDSMLKSINLVITGPHNKKNVQQVKNDLENILINQDLSEVIKNFIKFFFDNEHKIHIYHAPEKEGMLPGSDMLKRIENNSEYIKLNNDFAEFNLSNKAREYAKELYKLAFNNLNNINKLLTKELFNFTQDKAASSIYEDKKYIANLLPESLNYKENLLLKTSELKHQTNYFLNLKQYIDLIQLVRLVNSDEINDNLIIIENLYNIFARYSSDDNIGTIYKEFAYVSKQLLTYYNLFGELIDQNEGELAKYNPLELSKTVKSLLNLSHHILLEGFHDKIINIKIDTDNQDTDYYHEALYILSNYYPKKEQDTDEFKNLNAEIYKKLGDINSPDSELAAEEYYKFALKYVKEKPEIYKKLAEIYMEKANNEHELNETKINYMREAAKYYLVLKNSIELTAIYKELIANNPKDPVLREEYGDVLFKLDMLDKAKKYYIDAKSQTSDEIKIESLCVKIHKTYCNYDNEHKVNYADEFFNNVIKNQKYYDFDSISSDDLDASLIGQNNIEQNNNFDWLG